MAATRKMSATRKKRVPFIAPQTNREKRLIIVYQQTGSLRITAEQMGLSHMGVSNILKRLGIRRNPRGGVKRISSN